LRTKEADTRGDLVLLLVEETIERNFGWVFFYDSKRHIETGDIRHTLAGNAPIVVTKTDGRIYSKTTLRPFGRCPGSR
jgi:hypothetical protein